MILNAIIESLEQIEQITNPTLWYIPMPSINVPLPVELTSFTSKLINDKVQLNWSTKTEVNNYGFNVERRINEGRMEQHWICRRQWQLKLT